MEIIKIENNDGQLVTTSNNVAEALGVRHDNLMRRIDTLSEKFSSPQLRVQFYIPSEYRARDGRMVRNYLITKMGVAQLCTAYQSDNEMAFEISVQYHMKFDDMEKALQNQFQVPQSFKEALQLALKQAEQIEELESNIKENQPRVSFAKSIEVASDCILVREYSKILANEKIHLGEKKLYRWFREKGFVLKNKTEPTQMAVERDLFKVEEGLIKTAKGDRLTATTKITGKGQLYFMDVLKKEFLREQA